ncbi:MAG: SemiSWEET family transporter [Pseudomonadota bacterium]
MFYVDAIGLLAVVVSTGSIAPQLYKTWRTRSAADFSYGWLLAALAGAALWLAYGLLKADWAVVAGNIIGATLLASLLAMKMRYSQISS